MFFKFDKGQLGAIKTGNCGHTGNKTDFGGIDIMSANALRFLYRSGDINDDQLDDLLFLLEDYHADKTRKEIEAEMAKLNC